VILIFIIRILAILGDFDFDFSIFRLGDFDFDFTDFRFLQIGGSDFEFDLKITSK
jgi:hypothetical protein